MGFPLTVYLFNENSSKWMTKTLFSAGLPHWKNLASSVEAEAFFILAWENSRTNGKTDTGYFGGPSLGMFNK